MLVFCDAIYAFHFCGDCFDPHIRDNAECASVVCWQHVFVGLHTCSAVVGAIPVQIHSQWGLSDNSMFFLSSFVVS